MMTVAASATADLVVALAALVSSFAECLSGPRRAKRQAAVVQAIHADDVNVSHNIPRRYAPAGSVSGSAQATSSPQDVEVEAVVVSLPFNKANRLRWPYVAVPKDTMVQCQEAGASAVASQINRGLLRWSAVSQPGANKEGRV